MKKLKKSFFDNYISKSGISKSEFSYYLCDYLDNLEIPDYINKAFDKIINISLKK